MQAEEVWVQSLGWEDPLEEDMANLSNILAWKVPWAEEPSRLQFMRPKTSDHWASECTHTLTHSIVINKNDFCTSWFPHVLNEVVEQDSCYGPPQPPNSSSFCIQALSTNTICIQSTELEKRRVEQTHYLGKKIREKALREEGTSV